MPAPTNPKVHRNRLAELMRAAAGASRTKRPLFAGYESAAFRYCTTVASSVPPLIGISTGLPAPFVR
jgi:hypothetical protein